MRRYAISVDGVGEAEFVAETASKARYRAYVAVKETGRRLTFRDFLGRCCTLHHGPAQITSREAV